MTGKATARDVAQAAGVSVSTVDRVLNGRGGVAAEKERRVLDWARRLRLDRALDQRPARTLRITVLIQPPENPFHAALQSAFEAANDGFRHLNMQFRVAHVAPADPSATAQAIRAHAGADAMAICVAHDAEIAAALAAFADQGKPVVTLATAIRDGGRHTYVGPDNWKAGRVAGELMGRLMGPAGGEVVMIAGMLSMIGHEEREMGFRSVLRERHPQCRLIEVLQSLEQGERAGDLVYRTLKRNPGVRGLYNASAGAQPVVDAILALGRRDEVIFITHELTEERRKLLRDGLIDAVIDQNPEVEVRTAVEVLAAYFGRIEAPPRTTITPIQIHMIENC